MIDSIESFRELGLGHPLLPALAQAARERQLNLDEGGFFWRQLQEFSYRADLPPLRLQTRALRLLNPRHDLNCMPNFRRQQILQDGSVQRTRAVGSFPLTLNVDANYHHVRGGFI